MTPRALTTRALPFAIAMILAVACGKAVNVKYADRYGFLPENDAKTNSEALQSCLDGGGTIRVRKPGVYQVSRTLLLDANTDLAFAEGVVLSKAAEPDGTQARHVFINRGAYSREYDENISISGLNLRCNGLDSRSAADVTTAQSASPAGTQAPTGTTQNAQQPAPKLDAPLIVGLSCQLAFFYVKNLNINNFTLLDLPPHDFAIQICTFENVTVENVHIEGMKDAVHFGPGRNFTVRHGIFKTYDDPIALNAHDYTTSNSGG